MGIISINEKMTSTNPTHTTGREVSYRTADRFGENIQDPYVSGKFYFWHNNGSDAGARFGAFWDTGTTEENLTWYVSGAQNWNERNTRYHTSASQSWTSFTIDLSGVTSPGRLVIYAARFTTKYNSDTDIDDIKLHAANGAEVNLDPSESSVRTNNLWQRYDDTKVITSYSTAKSQYPSSGWENIPTTISTTTGLWNHIKEDGGGSTGTGSDNAADNNDDTIYLYWEGSSGGVAQSNGGSYVRWTERYNLSTGVAV
jgi:hypothetical protein